ncbi:hypothetical protein F4780DRAFT_419111 [Xylariomycetidae sp. FL0641]|nr:hypothetical protein F4780DRAFT_419111 [Xylariomycetidae sp. FL0641]
MASSKGYRTSNASMRAGQYLNVRDTAAPGTGDGPRPNLHVPNDARYSMQRFLNPHTHVDDRPLRPAGFLHTPLTEAQARDRMAAILASTAQHLPGQQQQQQQQRR